MAHVSVPRPQQQRLVPEQAHIKVHVKLVLARPAHLLREARLRGEGAAGEGWASLSRLRLCEGRDRLEPWDEIHRSNRQPPPNRSFQPRVCSKISAA